MEAGEMIRVAPDGMGDYKIIFGLFINTINGIFLYIKLL